MKLSKINVIEKSGKYILKREDKKNQLNRNNNQSFQEILEEETKKLCKKKNS